MMSDYLFGKHHERVDRFLVGRLGRPSREQRFENRMESLRLGTKAAMATGLFIVGTGKGRAGSVAVKTGQKAILRSGATTGQIVQGVRTWNYGMRLRRHGRILQGAGLATGFIRF